VTSATPPSVIGQPARPVIAEQRPAAQQRAEATAEAPASAEAEQPKKRGFWARLFGRGGNDDNDKKN
jgi:hypothetical protein